MTNGSATSHPIPDEVQAGIRERIKLARVSLGIPVNQVQSITPGTVNHYENYDISAMKVGVLYDLAREYGFTLEDFTAYLFGGAVDQGPTEEARQVKRMGIYLRTLPEDLRIVALDLVARLVDWHAEQTGAPHARNLHTSTALNPRAPARRPSLAR